MVELGEELAVAAARCQLTNSSKAEVKKGVQLGVGVGVEEEEV